VGADAGADIRHDDGVLIEVIWDLISGLLAPTFSRDDFRRDRSPETSAWLRRRNRWNVAVRVCTGPSTAHPPALSSRWRRVVLQVDEQSIDVSYRRRRRFVRHRVATAGFNRRDVRLPKRFEVSRFRQIFSIDLGGAPCEIAIWASDVWHLKRALSSRP
jgi:hypothetical protein